jgi:aminopeptidase YwaD
VYPDLDALFRARVSGVRAQATTAKITEFYRSPGSSGYHAATQLAAEGVREAGADDVAEDRYPLDGRTQFLGRTMPPAWEPIDAELSVVGETVPLVTFRETPSTLPWWCGSTPNGGAVVDVVDVGRGLRHEDYDGRPVRGNAVLIRDSETRPAWAHAADLARHHGAVGIITDFLHSQTPPWRTRTAIPEAVQLLRLAPRWDNPWAFAVGFKEASRLAELAGSGGARVRARVEARTFEGEGVNVLATIRGTEPKERVLFVAHTSAGTKPCANCAAGPALMIELCRAIAGAIREGTRPRPRRSIQFMFVAEGLGSARFLSSHQAASAGIQACLCLDSVGHAQAALKSSLVHYRSPDSAPSYVSDLAAALIDELPKEAAWPFRQDNSISLVNFQTLPYTPWSDNHYWASTGVPAPLFMSWPDLYFHTQLLTAEHTDPLVFERAGRVLGSLAVGIARAGWAEAAPIMQEVATRAAARVGRAARDGLASMARNGSVPERIRADVRWLVRRDAAAIRSAVQLVHEAGHKDRAEALAAALVVDLEARGTAVLATLQSGEPRDTRNPSATVGLADHRFRVVPRRKPAQLSPGVVGLGYDEMARLVEAMRAEDEGVNWETLRIFGDELWNFSDGRRTIGEIAHAVCVEFGFQVHPKHFLMLAEGFQRANLLTLEKADG